jgi:hypothetical protein
VETSFDRSLLVDLPKLLPADIAALGHLRQLASEAVTSYTGRAAYIIYLQNQLDGRFELSDREVAKSLNLLSNEARAAEYRRARTEGSAHV